MHVVSDTAFSTWIVHVSLSSNMITKFSDGSSGNICGMVAHPQSTTCFPFFLSHVCEPVEKYF
jgi:hypothetical protein